MIGGLEDWGIGGLEDWRIEDWGIGRWGKKSFVVDRYNLKFHRLI
jgi:hypothetical protein